MLVEIFGSFYGTQCTHRPTRSVGMPASGLAIETDSSAYIYVSNLTGATVTAEFALSTAQ